MGAANTNNTYLGVKKKAVELFFISVIVLIIVFTTVYNIYVLAFSSLSVSFSKPGSKFYEGGTNTALFSVCNTQDPGKYFLSGLRKELMLNKRFTKVVLPIKRDILIQDKV